MTIPKTYGDLTVAQFQKLEMLKSNKELEPIDMVVEKLSILTGETIDTIENLDTKTIYSMLQDTIYLNSNLEGMPLNVDVKICKKHFVFIDKISDFTIVQQKDFSEFLKMNNNNYILCLPEILCICHKEKTKDGYKYVSENHFENIELFKKSKLKDVLGAVFFYSKCSLNYERTLSTCMEINNKVISETMAEIESDKAFQDFLNSGDGNTMLA